MSQFRIFATCDIGPDALNRLRERGWDLEVYGEVEPPPRALVLARTWEKVWSRLPASPFRLRRGRPDVL